MMTDLRPMELPPSNGVIDRRTFLPRMAQGQRVLHLGCVDEGLTLARSGTGRLLHEELARVADTLVGVDLSAAGLAELQSVVPGDYVHGNVEELGDLDLPEVDLVIAAELIEHLPNPGRFYRALGEYLRSTGARALLTTPNSYSWVNQAKFAFTRREPTHPDHVLTYSPVTLQRTLESAHLEPVAWWCHAWKRPASFGGVGRNLVDRAVLGWNPWLAPGIVVEVRPLPER